MDKEMRNLRLEFNAMKAGFEILHNQNVAPTQESEEHNMELKASLQEHREHMKTLESEASTFAKQLRDQQAHTQTLANKGGRSNGLLDLKALGPAGPGSSQRCVTKKSRRTKSIIDLRGWP